MIDIIEEKRKLVRKAYADYGNSPEYEKELDELHDLKMVIMAARFREERGLGKDAVTPYD